MITAAGVRNWAGNVTFSGPVHRPGSLDELCELVAGAPRLRVLGTGHSFNRIADGEQLVSVADLVEPPRLDEATGAVTLSAGMRYGELAPWLHARGRALGNLGSLPHISVAGACATGTHGSGVGNRCLAAAASAVRLVLADGSQLVLDRADPRFPGAVLSLGALGVVTELTLDTVPAFDVSQTVYDDLPWAAVDDLGDVLAGGYSVSVFTRWRSRDLFDMVWVKRRADADAADVPATYFGAHAADGPRHPIPGVDPVHCTAQLAAVGAWFERLPHFRLDFTPSSGDELQSEYLLDAAVAGPALSAVRELADVLAPVLLISEIRAIAADELWLSPASGRASVALHFTWTDDAAAVAPVVAALERSLAPFEPRPHWGKVFSIGPDVVRSRYPRFADFARLAGELDPGRTFRNEYLEPYL